MEPMLRGMQFPIPRPPFPREGGMENGGLGRFAVGEPPQTPLSVSPPLRAGEGLGVGASASDKLRFGLPIQRWG